MYLKNKKHCIESGFRRSNRWHVESRDISIIKLKTAISRLHLGFCQSVKSKAFVFDYKRKPTGTHRNTHTKALSVAWDCCERWLNNKQPKTHIISAERKTFSSKLSVKHRNLIITIMHFWKHPVTYEKVCEATVEFSQPMRDHVWFHFIYICHRWLSAITECRLTVDSCISLVTTSYLSFILTTAPVYSSWHTTTWNLTWL